MFIFVGKTFIGLNLRYLTLKIKAGQAAILVIMSSYDLGEAKEYDFGHFGVMFYIC